MEPPSKKPRRLLEDSESDSDEDSHGGVSVVSDSGFKINEEYARRFEYNKKREEKQQLEAKLGKSSTRKQANAEEESDDEEDSSDEEEEDEDGELATEALDSEIFATLNAIRSRDPRVYDKDAKFYSEVTDTEPSAPKDKKEKPMYLQDYHRQNLLNGGGDADESEDTPKTFVQQQEDLKKSVIKEIKAAEEDQSSEEDEDGDFLIAKSQPLGSNGTTATKKPADVHLDVENADKDPETFLSNFLTSRAWIPTKSSTQFQPFESDDEEEEKRAEEFEEAYNFRFEDPSKMNEKIVTHARDTTNDFSVRREETSSRKKKRDAERAKKEEARRERENQKNRLRKLKMEELEEKVEKIKQAAGLKAASITEEEWAQFLDENWDDEKWEKEMAKRFGEDYYAEDDIDLNGGEDDGKKKKRPKKPTWDDDIDIKDLVPDFDDEAEPGVSLTDDEEDEGVDEGSESVKKKSRTQEKHDQKRAARKERQRIEAAVERNLDLDPTLLPGATKKNSSRFRYRETSPQSFGLTARDILMADDAQLNQFVGLKKLAAFRDPERKRRDLKKMGKKARLRQWRKDTFGTEDEPEFELKQAPPGAAAVPDEKADEMKVDIREGGGSRKKRKRSKKH